MITYYYPCHGVSSRINDATFGSVTALEKYNIPVGEIIEDRKRNTTQVTDTLFPNKPDCLLTMGLLSDSFCWKSTPAPFPELSHTSIPWLQLFPPELLIFLTHLVLVQLSPHLGTSTYQHPLPQQRTPSFRASYEAKLVMAEAIFPSSFLWTMSNLKSRSLPCPLWNFIPITSSTESA